MKLFTTLVWVLLYIPAVMGQAVQKKNIQGVRDAGICFTIGNRIYVGGGVGQKDFWAYDPAADTWTRMADIPGVKYERSFGAGVEINGKGYAGLGADSAGRILKYDWWEYDPATGAWTQKADYPGISPDGCAVFAVNNKAYFVGGTNNQNVYASVYEYNPATDIWKQLANYPAGPLIFGTAFTIGNYGYVTCGASVGEITETHRFDPTDNTWMQMADFPGTPRQTAVGFVVGGLAYVGGGQKGYTQAFKDFFRYNPANNSWAPVGDIGNKGRAWGMAAALNGKGYVGMGWDFGATFFNDWWEFTPSVIASVSGAENTERWGFYDYENKTLTVEANAGKTVKIMDISGKILHESIVQNKQQKIDLQWLSSGIYFIQTQNSTGVQRDKIWVR